MPRKKFNPVVNLAKGEDDYAGQKTSEFFLTTWMLGILLLLEVYRGIY